MIRIGVSGARGKMGIEVINAVIKAEDMELVCAIDKFDIGQNIYGSVYTEGDLAKSIQVTKPDVIVDFTQPASVYENAEICLNLGVKPVIGTTGLNSEQIEELKKLSEEKNVGCLIAPNFSIGAILMMEFAAKASRYFDNAEIIEFHHNQKKDAPSGTALKTAMMFEEKDYTKGNSVETETLKSARGGIAANNIHIHSVRMPGYMASQEVLFGAAGQTLSIRHDSTERGCYMPGVLLAIRHVYKNNDFIFGLENIL